MKKLLLFILFFTTTIIVAKNCQSDFIDSVVHSNNRNTTTTRNVTLCTKIIGCSWCYKDHSCNKWDSCTEKATFCINNSYTSQETRDKLTGTCVFSKKPLNLKLHIALIFVITVTSILIVLIAAYLFNKKFRVAVKKFTEKKNKIYDSVELGYFGDSDDDDNEVPNGFDETVKI